MPRLIALLGCLALARAAWPWEDTAAAPVIDSACLGLALVAGAGAACDFAEGAACPEACQTALAGLTVTEDCMTALGGVDSAAAQRA